MVIPTVIFILFLYPSLTSAASNYNVADFGAIPDGKTDSSAGFLSAWTAACGSAGRPTINVPTGKFLIRQPVVFTGSQCKSSSVIIQIQGSLVAPSDYRVLGESTTWLSFQSVTGVTISGGILDGQGGSLWTCKNSGQGGCPTGATTLGFTNSNNILIDGMTSINSQIYHIVINGCNNVKIQGVKVSASGDSPNTDGIHVQFSTGVTILNSRAATGDDCISVGPGTTGLWIENFSCGPGHGISIGSLGKTANEPGVQNVTVKTVKFTGTDNGVRIKSWGRPSNGFVAGVLFQHITMADVKNPIIIDQNYCPDDNGCPQKVSGVKISDVMYQDIHGSSATEVAVKFDCSSEHPCTDLRLQDVKLTYKSDQAALSSCSNADGSTSGFVVPSSCL